MLAFKTETSYERETAMQSLMWIALILLLSAIPIPKWLLFPGAVVLFTIAEIGAIKLVMITCNEKHEAVAIIFSFVLALAIFAIGGLTILNLYYGS